MLCTALTHEQAEEYARLPEQAEAYLGMLVGVEVTVLNVSRVSYAPVLTNQDPEKCNLRPGSCRRDCNREIRGTISNTIPIGVGRGYDGFRRIVSLYILYLVPSCEKKAWDYTNLEDNCCDYSLPRPWRGEELRDLKLQQSAW